VQTVFIKFATQQDRVQGFFELATRARINSLPGKVYQVPIDALRLLDDKRVGYRRATDAEVKAAHDQVRKNSRAVRVRPVTRDNLRQGMDELYREHEKKRAPAKGKWAFHNEDLYRPLEAWRPRGLDHDFWDFLVGKLTEWRAIRPEDPAVIRTNGLALLRPIRDCLTELAGDGSRPLPTVEALEWENVAPLFEIAQSIKGCDRPTFGSKLCHFLVPSAYFVCDNKLVKVKVERGPYKAYWEACKGAWSASQEKEACKCLLRDEIRGARSTPCDTYPWATKITELCQFVPSTEPR
jgi:hypothetical protein